MTYKPWALLILAGCVFRAVCSEKQNHEELASLVLHSKADNILQMVQRKRDGLGPLQKGCKAIGNKWILKIKRQADGSIERYKARLVVK